MATSPGYRRTRKPVAKTKKKPLRKMIAKRTGTTRKEARGVIRNANRLIDKGKENQARNTIKRSLLGGKAAGVPRTAKTKASAAKTADKFVAKRTGTKPGRRIGRNLTPGVPRKVGPPTRKSGPVRPAPVSTPGPDTTMPIRYSKPKTRSINRKKG